MNVPDALIYPIEHFAADFKAMHDIGDSVWRDSRVAFVGLARNCGRWLAGNLGRLEVLASKCHAWQLHVETNDNADDTDQVLIDFCNKYRQATFHSQRLGRDQFSAEFAGPRTQALAEYRTACQRWVRECASGVDFVVVLDFDMWGGWSHAGLMHGVGSLTLRPDAYGMASVSVFQMPVVTPQEDGTGKPGTAWLHYDCWALRLNSLFDDYSSGFGGWKHQWLPMVGSAPIAVCSAFGGMAIYDVDAYLKGTYSGADCEHVTFHQTIAQRTGRQLFLDPAMRTVMHWLEADDGGNNCHH
jgi:hypothetical protein